MSKNIDKLLHVMTRLRDPQSGCPWDIEQSFETIAPYTIEEAYEVAQAIQDSDMDALRDELGDLLLQVVYHAEMANESGAFDFDQVAGGIADKMMRRHPHVFSDSTVDDVEQQSLAWETQKAVERNAQAARSGIRPSALDGVALALPALMRAEKLQKRASRVGFDWHDTSRVVEKISEELSEIAEEEVDGSPTDALLLECGDLLFACVNLLRHLKIDAESALREANYKFEQRFRRLEDIVESENQKPEHMSLVELEKVWQRVKSEEI